MYVHCSIPLKRIQAGFNCLVFKHTTIDTCYIISTVTASTLHVVCENENTQN